MILSPELQEIDATIFDVFVKIVVVLAILDELIAWAIKPHEGIERGTLKAGEPVYETSVEAIVDVFILLFFDKPALQGQRLPVLFCIEEHIQVKSYAAVLSAYDIVGLIFEDLPVLVAVLGGIVAIGFGANDDQREAVDPYGEAHVQGIAARNTFYGDRGGMSAEIGEIDRVTGRQHDAVVTRGVGGRAGAGDAENAYAGHGEELRLVVNRPLDLHLRGGMATGQYQQYQ